MLLLFTTDEEGVEVGMEGVVSKFGISFRKKDFVVAEAVLALDVDIVVAPYRGFRIPSPVEINVFLMIRDFCILKMKSIKPSRNW